MHFTIASICITAMAMVSGTAAAAVVPTVDPSTLMPGEFHFIHAVFDSPIGRRDPVPEQPIDTTNCAGDFASPMACAKECNYDAGHKCVNTIDVNKGSVKTSCCRPAGA